MLLSPPAVEIKRSLFEVNASVHHVTSLMTFDLKVLLLLRTVNKMLCWSPDRQRKCLFKTTNCFLSNVSKYSKVVKCSVFKFSSAALVLWVHVLPPPLPNPPPPSPREAINYSGGAEVDTPTLQKGNTAAGRLYSAADQGHIRTSVWATTTTEPESGPQPYQNQNLAQTHVRTRTWTRFCTCPTPVDLLRVIDIHLTEKREHYHDMKESHLYPHDATCAPYTQSHRGINKLDNNPNTTVNWSTARTGSDISSSMLVCVSVVVWISL